jgi:ParB family transcriptional regulator, chromosome partitioning protein
MQDRLDYVALSDIRYNPAINARRDTETDVTELAATIDTQNIGQPLLLRPSDRGYEPVDGGRRLRALKLLAEQGKIEPDHPVPAFIRELDDAEALSLSLATAITRLDLDPADEALNFADLADKGMSPDNIAARFGIPLRRVKQRLAIGRLPSEIVAALKAGEIDLADAQAFTLTQDPKQALKLFNKGVCRKWQIEQELTKQRISATSAEAAYVGLDAYKAAGGAVDEDLFSNNAWLADGKLLSKLFEEKIKADEKQWLAEGWGFVMFEMDKPHLHKTGNWPWLKPEGERNLSKEEKARAEKLRAEIKRLDAAWKDNENPDLEYELADKLDSAKDELEALAGHFFTDAQKKKSGVVVRKEYQKIEVHFGMMKPAAAKKEAKLSKQTARDDDEDDPSPVRKIEPDAEADFTQALAVEMATVMTHAMQRAVISKPLEATRLAAAVLLTASNFTKPEGFLIDAPMKRSAEISEVADGALDHLMSDLGHNPSPAYVVEVFKGLGAAVWVNVFGICLAPLLKIRDDQMEHLRPIIDHFAPDVAAHWQPDEQFFKRMPRESLAAALGEAAIPGVTPSKKKKDLVEMAVRDLVPKGWLPKPLRTPSYKGPGSNAWADAQGAKAAGIEAEEESA